MIKLSEIWNRVFTPKESIIPIEISKDNIICEVNREVVSLPLDVELKPITENETIWSFDTRTKLTEEQSNKIEMVMGNNWERTSAYLGIIAKEFKK